MACSCRQEGGKEDGGAESRVAKRFFAGPGIRLRRRGRWREERGELLAPDFDVLLSRLGSHFGVPGFEGFQEPEMVGHAFIAGSGLHRIEHPVGVGEPNRELGADSLPEIEQTLVARALHHESVHGHVEFSQFVEGLAFGLSINEASDGLGVRLSPRRGRPARCEGLQCGAHIQNLLKILLVETDDSCPSIGLEFQVTLGGEFKERLANGGAADAEAFGEGGFGEAFSGGKNASEDFGAQGLRDEAGLIFAGG